LVADLGTISTDQRISCILAQFYEASKSIYGL